MIVKDLELDVTVIFFEFIIIKFNDSIDSLKCLHFMLPHITYRHRFAPALASYAPVSACARFHLLRSDVNRRFAD